MTKENIVQILQNCYSNAVNAKNKEAVVTIHLFAIKYAKEIQDYGLSEFIRDSGLPRTYRTEISKMINVSKFVNLKDNAQRLLGSK
jgi:hypothetical protein